MGQSARIPDINGFWMVSDNPISKVGVFPYSGKFISSDLDPGKLYNVYRPAEELSNPECISSFRLVPWSDDHPGRLMGTGEGAVKPEDKGVEGTTGERVYFDDDSQMLKANIKVFSKSHADRIKGGKVELSAGYQCKYEYNPGEWNGQHYDYIQRDIRGNHLASVDQGRMGPDVSVLDGLIFTIDQKEFKSMKKTYKVRTLMNTLIRYAKDAEENPPEEATEKGEIDQLKKLIGQISPLMQSLSELPTIMAKTEMEEEGEEGPEDDPLALAAKDAEEDEADKKKKEDDAKAAKDAEELAAKEKDKDKTGMDSKETIAKIVGETMKKLAPQLFEKQKPAMDAKEIMVEVSKRNKLADTLSWHVGTFDHAEMTHEEVARYGVKKLGLNAPAGQEINFLSGYLHNRPAPKPVAMGMDSKTGESFLDKQLAANNEVK
jgi:hypothetical protein